MILTENGVLKLMQRIKSFITSQLNTKASSVHTHSISEIDNLASQLGGGYSKSEVDTLLNDKANSSHTHSKSEITDFPTIPSKTSDLTNDSGFLTSHQDLSGYIPKSGGAVLNATLLGRVDTDNIIRICGGTDNMSGASIQLNGKDTVGNKGMLFLVGYDGTSRNTLTIKPDGNITASNGVVFKNVAMQEDVVPRSGGAVITGTNIGRADNTGNLNICGGTIWSDGGYVALRGKDSNLPNLKGTVEIGASSSTYNKQMVLYPDGTWTWDGQPVQISSDARLKQQITQIDNALLDAWESVELCQFKYNDAVNEKGDNARLHTGYVVQQIDTACKSHNVDISDYGLYCHEEYPQETEEVEIEQEDGTIKKETRVIREASEHYSLRYTETLVVECAYLRREVSRLKQQNENLEQRLKILEQSVK